MAHHAALLDSNHLAYDIGGGAELGDVPGHDIIVALDRAAIRVAVAQHGFLLLIIELLVVLRAKVDLLVPGSVGVATVTAVGEGCGGGVAGAALVEHAGEHAEEDEGGGDGGDVDEAEVRRTMRRAVRRRAMGRSVRRSIRGEWWWGRWHHVAVVFEGLGAVVRRASVVGRAFVVRRAFVVLEVAAELRLRWLLVEGLADLGLFDLWLLNLDHLNIALKLLHLVHGLFRCQVMVLLRLWGFRARDVVVRLASVLTVVVTVVLLGARLVVSSSVVSMLLIVSLGCKIVMVRLGARSMVTLPRVGKRPIMFHTVVTHSTSVVRPWKVTWGSAMRRSAVRREGRGRRASAERRWVAMLRRVRVGAVTGVVSVLLMLAKGELLRRLPVVPVISVVHSSGALAVGSGRSMRAWRPVRSTEVISSVE